MVKNILHSKFKTILCDGLIHIKTDIYCGIYIFNFNNIPCVSTAKICHKNRENYSSFDISFMLSGKNSNLLHNAVELLN